MGEALDAMGRHHLYEAEQKAYSAAILSVDSTELADALTMLSLVFMLEGKEHQAEMVMAVLPREQTMELVRLQDQANDQGRRRERLVFGSLVGALLLAVGGGYWWNRRRTAAFQQKVDLLMQQASQPAVRADIVKTKQGVDVLYAILHDENISQMGKREQLAVSETLHIVEPDLASRRWSPRLLPQAEKLGEAIVMATITMRCPYLGRLPSASFWSSLSMDISLLIHMYPPKAFTFGRYCVRADFLRLAFTSCLIFATPICLLFLSAIALQLSSVSSCCAPATVGNSTNSPSITARAITVVLDFVFVLSIVYTYIILEFISEVDEEISFLGVVAIA